MGGELHPRHEGLNVDIVAAVADSKREHQIDRALEERGQPEGSVGKAGGGPEELHGRLLGVVVWRNPIGEDCGDLALFDALSELESVIESVRVDLEDSDPGAGTGRVATELSDEAIDPLRVARVRQDMDVEGRFLIAQELHGVETSEVGSEDECPLSCRSDLIEVALSVHLEHEVIVVPQPEADAVEGGDAELEKVTEDVTRTYRAVQRCGSGPGVVEPF